MLVPGSLLSQAEFKLGIENISTAIVQQLKGYGRELSIGLVTNQTGKSQAGVRTIDVLLQRGLHIKRIFAPEHGIEGLIKAEQEVPDAIDSKTAIPVVSLYGKGSGKKIGSNKIKDLDVLIFDIQDSGMRHYTYISTLLQVMEVAAKYNKSLFVFDRPNPLGAIMEGPIADSTFKSFITPPIPLRYGMTLGELARYFNRYVLKKQVKLQVVPMKAYERTVGLPGSLLAPLSPNIPSKESCLGYSFLGLLGEVKPLDTGLGTDNPMRCIALPSGVKLLPPKWKKLQLRLHQLGVESLGVTYYSPRKKENCQGLQVSLHDPNNYSAFDVMITVLRFFYQEGVPLTFSDVFDKAAGTSKVREYIIGKITWETLAREVNEQIEGFARRAQDLMLYEPLPKLLLLK